MAGPDRPERGGFRPPPRFQGPRRPDGDHAPSWGDRRPSSGPRPAGTARPAWQPAGDAAPAPRSFASPAPVHSVRVREGDREIEIAGTPEFVRELLDRLLTAPARGGARTSLPPVPAAWREPASEHAEAASGEPRSQPERATAEGPPEPPAAATPAGATAAATEPAQPAARRGRPRKDAAAAPGRTTAKPTSNGAGGDLERRILGILERSTRPVPAAAIREELPRDVTAQQLRRALERSDRVRASSDRPVLYSLR